MTNPQYIIFNVREEDKADEKMMEEFKKLRKAFCTIMIKKKSEYIRFLPFIVNIHALVPKNQWSNGHYVALDQPDGSLDLYLSFIKLSAMEEFPHEKLLWVLFHEFRHKIQRQDPALRSFFEFPNWANFKKYIAHKERISEDMVEHIFHELNPAEADAHAFACEATGTKFSGTAFNITEESLGLIDESQSYQGGN